ncbi:MAG: hypothetical protein R2712_18405 [Vicinamibacterales bacterium]
MDVPRHGRRPRRPHRRTAAACGASWHCGEWIESHALHASLLHAPDFLGVPDAIAMAGRHKARVADGPASRRRATPSSRGWAGARFIP